MINPQSQHAEIPTRLRRIRGPADTGANTLRTHRRSGRPTGPLRQHRTQEPPRGNRIRTGRLVYAPHSRPERPGHAVHILHRVCRTGDSGRRTRRTAAGDTAAGAAPDTAEPRDNPYSPQTLHLRPQHRQQNRFSAAFRAGQEGGEMGVKCKLGELRGELQRVRLNLAGCKGVDTLHMRINVYAMRGRPYPQKPARGTGLFLGSGVGGRQDDDRRPAALRDIRKRRLPDLGREPDTHAGGGEILDSRPAARAHLHPRHESGAVEDAQGRGRAERRRAGGAGIENPATVSVPAAERPALRSGHPTAAALCGLQIIC